jgi:acyl dehydratase
VTEPLAPHRVVAYNIAATSENKIHDDAVAAQFGFEGGLVPGVAVFGYMAHLPVARWGRDWLARGRAECRFVDPVYDGREAIVEGQTDGDGITVAVRSEGRLCATGRAALTDGAAVTTPSGRAAPAPPAQRPPADERTLAAGTLLGIEPFTLTPEEADQWLADLRETDSIYRRERLAHPAILLRIANAVLMQNVVLGPWIHVGSRLQNLAVMPLGAELGANATVTRNHDHKGHRFVELDIEVVVDGRTVAATIAHTAIYRPRQVAAAAGTPP